jgi:6-phosphofructokinase 1
MPTFGILTSGGDAPGMNAAIRAAVRSAGARGVDVAGFLNGYSGLTEGHWRRLDDRAVGNILHRGGTFLGTSRCPAFLKPEGRKRAASVARSLGVEGLVVIGGDGSLRGALAFNEEHAIPVAAIPATIDNDIYGSDNSLGFDTALNTALSAIDRLRDTAESTGMLFFVEVMGRTSGEIALHVGLAAGAEAVIVPDREADVEALCGRIRRSREQGKKSHIVVVAEGGEPGRAMDIARVVGAKTGVEYRVCVLGHTQRGGEPTARDRILAARLGAAAVDCLLEERSGVMLGEQAGRIVPVPLAEATARSKPADPTLLDLALNLS